MLTQPHRPKIFISYSHTSREHIDKVIEIAEDLRADGIEVIIDKWHLKEGDDIHAFMERMVSDPTISRVFIICDRGYAEKADRRSGGVGTEAQIISPELYSRMEQSRFIPIVTTVDESGRPHLPVFLRNRLYLDFSTDKKFRTAYAKLLDIAFGRVESPSGGPGQSAKGANRQRLSNMPGCTQCFRWC